MLSYNYRFEWIDKNKTRQRFYIEASSKKDAIDQFEAHHEVKIADLKPDIRRLT